MKTKKVIRTESYFVKNNNEVLFTLCNKSKLLYNKATFLCRQHYFENEDNNDVLESFLYYRDLYKQLKDFKEYKSLPAQTSQQTLKLVDKNWKSYRKSIKAYWKNKKKFKTIPKLPKYKKSHYQVCMYPGNNLTLKNNEIKIPKTNFKVKTSNNIKGIDKQGKNNIKQLRIVPQRSGIKIEIIYEKEVKDMSNKLDNDKVIGIDIGLNNLMTITSNDEELIPCIINGRSLKSMNQYSNKKIAKLKSKLQEGQYTSNRIDRTYQKRKHKIDDYLHKSSRWVVDFCKFSGIGTIIIGNNKDWKQNINIGKKNNQNFVSVPFDKLIKMIKYKAEEIGIEVVITEESYTSKIDHFVGEKMKHHKKYKGKRIKRGLFKSSINKVLNADVNGALGIIRKVVNESFDIQKIIDRGLVFRPVRINVN